MWNNGDTRWYLLGLPLLMLGGVREQQEKGFCLREDKLGPRVTTAQIIPLLARAQSYSMWIGCAASIDSPRQRKVMVRSGACPGSPVRSSTRQNWRQDYNVDLRFVQETGPNLPTTWIWDPTGKQCQRQGWAQDYLQHNWGKNRRPWRRKVIQVPPDQGSKPEMSQVEKASLLSSEVQGCCRYLQSIPVTSFTFPYIPLFTLPGCSSFPHSSCPK